MYYANLGITRYDPIETHPVLLNRDTTLYRKYSMKKHLFRINQLALASLAILGVSLTSPASAAVIDWSTWSNPVAGTTSGSATGTFSGGITASYSGELESFISGYPSYGPSGTFNGGTVGNAPPSANGIIQLYGGNGGVTDTITFSQAVTDPVLAIWSLGQPGINASFNFIGATPTLESGGPSNEYAGSTIAVIGNNVYGSEGNGTIQFTGTYTSLSWTNPTYENWYGFTVGVAVPEPETFGMMLMGLGMIGFIARRRRYNQS